MNKQGNFRIKRKINEIGFFCDIQLSVQNMDSLQSQQFIVSYQDEDIHQTFKTAIQAGVIYFMEKQFKNTSHSFSIKINKLQLIPVDSSFSLVMFSTIKALEMALNSTIDGLKINEKTGILEFPK